MTNRHPTFQMRRLSSSTRRRVWVSHSRTHQSGSFTKISVPNMGHCQDHQCQSDALVPAQSPLQNGLRIPLPKVRILNISKQSATYEPAILSVKPYGGRMLCGVDFNLAGF